MKKADEKPIRGVKVCKTCNRKHGSSEACHLFLRSRIVEHPKTGELLHTKRWCT